MCATALALDSAFDTQKNKRAQRQETKKEQARNESIVKKEEMEEGNVSFATYMSFFYVDEEYWQPKTAMILKLLQLFGMLLLMFIAQLVATGSEYFLGVWANKNEKEQENNVYPITFAILGVCTLILALVRAMVFFKLILRGARYLHDKSFDGVLFAPMNFYESNPIGRILNRFSKDMWIVDEMVCSKIYIFVSIFGFLHIFLFCVFFFLFLFEFCVCNVIASTHFI